MRGMLVKRKVSCAKRHAMPTRDAEPANAPFYLGLESTPYLGLESAP